MGVDELDALYFHGSVREVAKAVAAFTTAYDLTRREMYEKVLGDFRNGEIPDINRDLYEAYSRNFRKAVNDVLQSGSYGDPYFDMQMQFEANVSRFAAYKAYQATKELSELEPGQLDTVGRAKLNKYNRWQATEYNTAMARARTARQFTDFTSDPKAKLLYPNLKWVKTRSAHPREEHEVFWDLVLPKDDDFWKHNMPGTLWNCKCDLIETDAPIHYTEGYREGMVVSQKGLKENPAKTGKIFSDDCAYIDRDNKSRRQYREEEAIAQTCNIDVTKKNAKEKLLDKTSECVVNDQKYEVIFEPIGINHYVKDMFGKDVFWIKNEILADNIVDYIKHSRCEGKKISDTGHNTNERTVRLKEQTDYFFYFSVVMPTGETLYLHLGRYNERKIGKAGKMYLYSISKNLPRNVEMP